MGRQKPFKIMYKMQKADTCRLFLSYLLIFHCWEIGGVRGITWQSFAYLGFLAFHVFHNFSQIGIRLQHFGILTHIRGALSIFFCDKIPFYSHHIFVLFNSSFKCAILFSSGVSNIIYGTPVTSYLCSPRL